MANAGRLSRNFRIDKPRKFRLDDFDPDDTRGLASEDDAAALLRKGVEKLAEMEEKLYAQDSWGVLLVFQAMDAAGKDSTIKHVMSGVNPAGCQVFSFKAPSTEELDHDFLWRCAKNLPERGRIGIFNRSYYEETLVVRVHPEFLARQRLPAQVVSKHIWEDRLEDIASWERYLTRNGITVVKFFLNVSRKEQKKRFLARLDDPEKNWKFSAQDCREREHWDEYMAAYEDAIRATSTEEAPWYVVPADHKWFTRLVVADAIVDRMERLGLAFPRLDATKKAELEESRKFLMGKK
ncbi:MAG: polyphosphate kinase 2 family protein [Planctomycetes bacterium]|nr:polyphosphate kinase 2 family protein [Planctomycetota bacterium]